MIPVFLSLLAISQQPLTFLENGGVHPREVQFTSREAHHTTFFTSAGLTLATDGGAAVRIRWAGAHPLHFEPLDPLPSTTSFFGNDGRAQTGVRSFQRLRARDIYAGVDLILYSTADAHLEYDLLVRPGANPHAIKIQVEGAPVDLASTGDLRIRLGEAWVVQRKPVAYQLSGTGGREPVDARYRVNGQEADLILGAYDASRELVVDPVFLLTWLGPPMTGSVRDIAVGPGDTRYIAGTTRTPAYPNTTGLGAVPAMPPGSMYAMFVTKLSAGGLVWSAVFGWYESPNLRDIEVDAYGSVYVHAVLRGAPPPVNGSYISPSSPGQVSEFQAAVMKLNSTGTALLYSAVVSKSVNERGGYLALDIAGNAFVTGDTFSDTLPITAGPPSTPGGKSYVAKLNAAGTNLTACFNLDDDYVSGVAVGPRPMEDVYLAGTAQFLTATAGALNTVGGKTYVMRLSPNLAGILYAARFGADSTDQRIVVDALGQAHVAANRKATATRSQDLVSYKLNAAGSELKFSTAFGGKKDEWLAGLAVDAMGKIHLTATSASEDFPVTGAPVWPWPIGGKAFYVRIDPAVGIQTALNLGLGLTSANGLALAANALHAAMSGGGSEATVITISNP